MASFLKFLSTAFMGDIMDDAKKTIKPGEVTVAMNISQNVLALICLALGLFPLLPMRVIYAALDQSVVSGVFLQPFSKLFGIGRNGVSLFMGDSATGIWRPLMVTIVFAGCLFLAYLILKSARAKKREVPVWYCGEEYDKNQVRYQAHSFYLALQQGVEKWLFPQVRYPSLGKWEGFYKTLDFDRLFFIPLVKGVFGLTKMIRKAHVGIPQVYMLWLVLGIIIVVLSLFIFAR
jgi:hydrogenase-4 component B